MRFFMNPRRLGEGSRYYSFGDQLGGWHFGFSRFGFHLITPAFSMKLERHYRWHGERCCILCGERHSGAHPDACIGELPGVRGACCGHGNRNDAYIGYENGLTLRDFVVQTQADWNLEQELSKWVPPDDDPDELYDEVIDITFPVHVNAIKEPGDYESLGRLAVEIAIDRIEGSKKIQKVVHG